MPGDHWPLVVVMGVEGAGKTTVGRRLADELGGQAATDGGLPAA